MEVPSWASKVATVAGLANPITAPVVVGKWVAEKATGALGPKTEAPAPVAPAPVQVPAAAPQQADPKVPNYDRNTTAQAAGNKPLVGADGKWDGAAILNGQTQASKDDPSPQTEQDNRCGPTAVLGAAVMGGKTSTASLAKNLQGHARAQDSEELKQIRGRIDSNQATHQDLSRLQHIMYNAYHDPNSSDPKLSPEKLAQMQRELNPGKVRGNDPANDYGGNTGDSFQKTKGDVVIKSPDENQSHITQLQPGQSFVQEVDSASSGAQLNHFITVGKDASGRTYVYDPGGKSNQPQVIYQDQNPDAFHHYTGAGMGGLDHDRPAVAQVGGVVSR